MDKPTCAVPECVKMSYLRGWCNAHYLRNQRYGSPLGAAKIPTTEDRFWAKVDKTEACWNWTGYTMPTGYGQFRNGGGKLAHRYSYRLAFGAIPDGQELDHICFNRKCVRPDHLRPVSRKQNSEHRRGALSNNKSSGIRGVYWREDCKKWEVKVGHNKKSHHLGLFPTISEAEAVAIAARNQLFTHNDVDRREDAQVTQCDMRAHRGACGTDPNRDVRE